MDMYSKALFYSTKPLIAVVRGGCVGIGFTHLGLFDFVYCSPDAYFMTPFMQSFQSPEGSSTLNFPIIMGKRLASEVLMLDKILYASEAVKCGFVNEIIYEIADEPEWLDLKKIPAIVKLTQTDYNTLINCKI